MTHSNSWYRKEYLLGLTGMGGGAGGILISGGPITSSSDGYQIKKSLRFVPGNAPYLARTVGASGDRRKWTISFWLKNSEITSEYPTIFSSSKAANTNDHFIVRLEHAGGELKVDERTSSSSSYSINTTHKHRDYSAWYHFVIAFDSSNAIAAERLRIYRNGKRETEVSGSYPAQNYESHWLETSGYATNHVIGREAARSDYETSGYLADVHVIDGLALSPAAFGEFSTTNLWNPKSFSLPAINASTTWSNMVTAGTGSFRTHNSGVLFGPLRLFDGNVTTACQDNSNSSGNSITFTPTNGIAFTQSVEVYCYGAINHVYSWEYNDGTTGRKLINGEKWHQVIEGSGTLKWIKIEANAANYTEATAIRIDGVVLRDGHTDPSSRNNLNDGRVWSDTGFSVTGGSYYDSNRTPAAMFDGDPVTECLAPDGQTITWKPGLTGSNIEVLVNISTSGGTSSVFTNNGTSIKADALDKLGAATQGWYSVGSSIDSSSGMTWSRVGSSNDVEISAVRVDGHVLLNSAPDNSVHLKFDDTNIREALGMSEFGPDFSSGTGDTYPILNTDSKGRATSGGRADSNAGTTDGTGLVYAHPGNVVDGDVHHLINTGSSKVTTVAINSAIVSNTQSKFYGTSLHCVKHSSTSKSFYANSADFAFGTGDWTAELWYWKDTLADGGGLLTSGTSATWPLPWDWSLVFAGGYGKIEFRGPGSFELTPNDVPSINEWHHVAVSKDSGTYRFFIDGVLVDSGTDTATIDDTYVHIGGWHSSANCFNGHIQDVKIYKGVAKYTAAFTPVRHHHNFAVNNIVAPTDLPSAATVSTATGALPFYNTSGDYGTTQESGERADSFAGTTDGTGLIYALGDGTSDVHASVNTGSGNKSLTVNGATTTSSNTKFYGTAITFDGSNDYLHYANGSTDLTDFDLVGGDFTLEVWVKSSVTTQQAILNKFDNASHWHWNWHLKDGGHKFEYSDSNGNGSPASYTVTSTINVCDGEWHHIAVVRNGGTISLFTDGFLSKKETGHSRTISSGDKYISVGRDDSNSGRYYFNGQMTDLRVYKGVAKYEKIFNVPVATAISLPYLQDSVVDSPTSYLPTGGDNTAGGESRGNYPTWNPLDADDASTLSHGNLSYINDGSTWNGVRATMAIPAGKWYWEYHQKGTDGCSYGIASKDTPLNDHVGGTGSTPAHTWGGANWYQNGSGTATGLAAMAEGDVIGVAYDTANGKLHFSRNGQWYGASWATKTSSQVAAGTDPVTSSVQTDVEFFPAHSNYSTGKGCHVNFGQRAFIYTAPTNFKALCTQNFSDTFSGSDVNNPSKFFDATKWQGDGVSPRTIELDNGDFTPDLVWLKNKTTSGRSHYLYDAIRTFGSQKELVPNSNVAEGSNSHLTQNHGYVSAVGDSTFTLGSGATNQNYTNNLDDHFSSWSWDAGTAASGANTNGTIDIASGDQWVNDTAGFSMTKFTGTGADATFGHGLSAKPEFLVIKKTSATGGDGDWTAQHVGATLGSGRLIMNENYANDTSNADTYWNSTAPTSTVISIGDHNNTNTSGQPHMCYAWRSVAGFSKFGSYTGNAAADGPFVYLGFRPRMIIFKNISTTNGWRIQDTAVNPYNSVDTGVYPNNTSVEDTAANWKVDYLSNGFKIKDSNNELNGSGNTIIYMAWAENPFKTARAR